MTNAEDAPIAELIRLILEKHFTPAIDFKAPYAKLMRNHAAAEIAALSRPSGQAGKSAKQCIAELIPCLIKEEGEQTAIVCLAGWSHAVTQKWLDPMKSTTSSACICFFGGHRNPNCRAHDNPFSPPVSQDGERDEEVRA